MPTIYYPRACSATLPTLPTLPTLLPTPGPGPIAAQVTYKPRGIPDYVRDMLPGHEPRYMAYPRRMQILTKQAKAKAKAKLTYNVSLARSPRALSLPSKLQPCALSSSGSLQPCAPALCTSPASTPHPNPYQEKRDRATHYRFEQRLEARKRRHHLPEVLQHLLPAVRQPAASYLARVVAADAAAAQAGGAATAGGASAGGA